MEPITLPNLWLRIIAGAALASLAVSLFFTFFGASREANLVSDFMKLFSVAVISYVGTGSLLAWKWRSRWTLLCLVILGSGLFSLLAIVVFGGQNGIPAYLARMRQQNSWQPLSDLVQNRTAFAVITAVIALPSSFVGAWLFGIVFRRASARD